MREQLAIFIKKLKDERIVSISEAATKQAVVLPLLSILGWDTLNIDEVAPEYSLKGRKVDYSLRAGGINKVFIEVKKIEEELENHQEQLLNYSFQEGVKLAVLTNGISWWFYLPLHEGSWEQRRFYTIDIIQQETEEIVSKFIDFLSKENIISGKAIQNAEDIYKSRREQDLIKETIPRAWNKLITEPNELLVELLANETEELCGYKPDNETVEQFLKNLSTPPSDKVIKPPPPPVGSSVKIVDLIKEGYVNVGDKIYRTYKGKRYEGEILVGGKIKLENGVIVNSLSKAATHISGKSENGWIIWKYQDKNGKTLSMDELRRKFKKGI